MFADISAITADESSSRGDPRSWHATIQIDTIYL